jgi:hypothetical protein
MFAVGSLVCYRFGVHENPPEISRLSSILEKFDTAV